MEEVGHVGSSVRRSCKKSEIIRQFINLRSITTCKTHWTGSIICLSHNLKFSPGLDPISAEGNADDMEKILMASYLCQVKTNVDTLKYIGDANAILQIFGYINMNKVVMHLIFLSTRLEIIKAIATVISMSASSAQNISRLINTFLLITNLWRVLIKFILEKKTQYRSVKNEPICAF